MLKQTEIIELLTNAIKTRRPMKFVDRDSYFDVCFWLKDHGVYLIAGEDCFIDTDSDMGIIQLNTKNRIKLKELIGT